MRSIRDYLEQCPEELLWMEFLEECAGKSRLYKARRIQNKDHLKTTYLGTVRRGNWLIDIYEDKEGNYWSDDRVMIGIWTISAYELVSGCKDPDNTYEKHTGVPSDLDKVIAKYGRIPPDWNQIQQIEPGKDREGEHENYSSNVA